MSNSSLPACLLYNKNKKAKNVISAMRVWGGFYQKWANICDIQVLLGHRSIKSTLVYTVLTAKDLRDMHDKFHLLEKSAGQLG